ncbi:MAG TPA: beta-ketoacyl-ACP synthase III [Acidobacteriota bacterium]|nr:beta-ketoacyl-ACP synthase III [Acidobacteriota bacterium]
MVRAVIVGSGSAIPLHRVTNEMLSKIMDASDEWIRERSGVEARHYVDEGTSTSDLGFAAATEALKLAAIDKNDLDLIIFATMTPDHFFPGCGGLLQAKLGLKNVPCFDIRQQCAGFIYGMQLANAQIRAGMAKTVLLVGAEAHTGFMPWTPDNYRYMYGQCSTPPTPEEYEWNTRFRNVTVLFGDAGAAVVIKAEEDGKRGVLDCILRTNGADWERIFVPGVGFRHRPYVDCEQIKRGDHIPIMNGTYVFRNAANCMTEVTKEILERNNLKLEDVSIVLMHQANKRINQRVQKMLGLPDKKTIQNIHKYGNTTAATIPLLWDECVRTGRIRKDDLVLMVAFGAGMHWGALLLQA